MRFLSAMLLGAVVAMPVQAHGTADETAIRATIGEYTMRQKQNGALTKPGRRSACLH